MNDSPVNPELSTEQYDAAALWQEIEPKAQTWYRQVFADIDEPIDEASIADFVAQEQKFFVAVLETVRRVSAHDQPIDLLFDIDGTIAIHTPSGDDLLRPALIPLLQRIYHEIADDRVTIGFFTTRTIREQMERIRQAEGYQTLRPFVHGSPIIQVRDPDLPNPRGELSTLDQKLAYLEYHQVDSVVTPMEPEQWHAIVDDLFVQELEKLARVSQLRRRPAKRSLVVIDDLTYPKYLSEQAEIFGVSLAGGNGDLKQFFLSYVTAGMKF